MSENVQGLRLKHKCHHESYRKLLGRTNTRRINLNRSGNTKWHLPVRRFVATTICSNKCCYRIIYLQKAKEAEDLQSRKK